MKKFFAVAALILGIFVAQISQVQAYEDPYENDPNFAHVHTSREVGTEYLDLTSIDVQEYDPPHYQIAGRFVVFSPYSASVHENYVVMRLNYSTKETLWFRNGHWVYSTSPGFRMTANALFRGAYGMDFYN